MVKIEGDQYILKAKGAREARALWRLVEQQRLVSKIAPSMEITTTMKKAQNFNPCGCILIFFAENGLTAISAVGAVSFQASLQALIKVNKYAENGVT